MDKETIFVLLLCVVFSPFVSAQGEEFLHAERRRGTSGDEASHREFSFENIGHSSTLRSAIPREECRG